jgi:hypothetical protein
VACPKLAPEPVESSSQNSVALPPSVEAEIVRDGTDLLPAQEDAADECALCRIQSIQGSEQAIAELSSLETQSARWHRFRRAGISRSRKIVERAGRASVRADVLETQVLHRRSEPSEYLGRGELAEIGAALTGEEIGVVSEVH